MYNTQLEVILAVKIRGYRYSMIAIGATSRAYLKFAKLKCKRLQLPNMSSIKNIIPQTSSGSTTYLLIIYFLLICLLFFA